jgi:hypothetical protein
MTDQNRLFYDDANDALRTVIQAMGGTKVVGCKLWPDKAPDAAARHLADCLNHAKAEKLSPDQLLLILRMGHGIGCHAGMQYLAQEAGYDVRPITPETERDRLADAVLEATRALKRATEIAERMPPVRAVA